MYKQLNKPEYIKNKNRLKVCKDQCLLYVDAFTYQIKELFFIKNKTFIGISKNVTYKSEQYKKFAKKNVGNFVHIYFPWNNTLVKSVPKKDYLTLKTNRNQDLITEEEQKILSNYTVAVLGLSVGSNIAITLAQAGISNKIILADFDELDTTNLNRILAGVHQIGVAKTSVTARKIYEDNPFADITLLPKGVNTTNLIKLLEKKNVNCLVDEIDDIKFKIEMRILAHTYKTPVVMVTDNGDGIVLHVERYDLGHDKIFGKSIAEWKKRNLNNLSKEESGGIIINNIVGGVEKVDPKMMLSVQRVMNKELVSWSQLGSAALLGGVAATVYIKRIALGENKQKDIRLHVQFLNSELESH